MIYHLQHTGSTNDDARADKYREGDIVWAEVQSAGRGQRGHTWQSREGENLTFSVVLEPTFLHITQQFSLLEVVALSLVDTLAIEGIEASIKWTNDIYVGDRKLVGILIEHASVTTHLHRTIVGIGINVNQREFDASLPNPTSMALVTERQFERERVLESFVQMLQRNYTLLREGGGKALHERYLSKLYRRNTPHTYALADGTRFEGTIRDVRERGELVVEHEDGSLHEYLFKEIEFVL